MNKQVLTFSDVSIPYFWGVNCIQEIGNLLNNIVDKKIIFVTDNIVREFYLDRITEHLNNNIKFLILSSPPGEKYKTLNILIDYLNQSLAWGADRATMVVCLGGGIPGNVGGLLAALLYRGINFIHISTTIIGLFDSVLSLKQAINSQISKNTIGQYHTPKAILGDLHFFNTLPKREIKSGICESIKNALAIDPQNISSLKIFTKSALSREIDGFKEIMELSIRAKNKVMANDKLEKKEALVLEYGHTAGHAIEFADSLIKHDNSISHGEAVGLGMLVAAEVSYTLGYLHRKALDQHYDLTSSVELEPRFPKFITAEQVLKIMMNDNKRGYIRLNQDEIGMILLKDLGQTVAPAHMPITPVKTELVLKVLKKFERS